MYEYICHYSSIHGQTIYHPMQTKCMYYGTFSKPNVIGFNAMQFDFIEMKPSDRNFSENTEQKKLRQVSEIGAACTSGLI